MVDGEALGNEDQPGMTSTAKPAQPRLLYERCSHCGGSGRDERVHDAEPEGPQLARRGRKQIAPCLPCLGRGFTKTPLTSQMVTELVEEYSTALAVAREFTELCESSEVSYLSDGHLHGIYARLTAILDRAERAGRLPAARQGRG